MPTLWANVFSRIQLEPAYRDFAITYFWKVRLYNADLRLYSSLEFYEDLYGTACEYGLFPEALWAYFRVLHPTEP